MVLLHRNRAQIQEAERKCIASAQQTAHLLHNVTDERNLVQDFPWWQMISCLICAGSILFVAEVFSEDQHRISEFSGYLHEDAETCLKVFEALSIKSPAAKQAVGMLQSLARLRSESGGTKFCQWADLTFLLTVHDNYQQITAQRTNQSISQAKQTRSRR